MISGRILELVQTGLKQLCLQARGGRRTDSCPVIADAERAVADGVGRLAALHLVSGRPLGPWNKT